MSRPRRPRHGKKRTFHESGATLTLVDHGTHHELKIGQVPILTSALLGTERDFGQLVPRAATRVLIGGLGFGSTLSGVLDALASAMRFEYARAGRTITVRPRAR